MNRAFKTQFHAGHADEKPIVTMAVTVNHGGRFKKLSELDRKHLVKHLETFSKQVLAFASEIKENKYGE